jgi:hypothetical protein
MHSQQGFDWVSKMKLQSSYSWQNVSCMGKVIGVGRHWLNAWRGRRRSKRVRMGVGVVLL